MREVKERVTYCSICSNITDVDPCFYCTDAGRDHRIICVVEEPQNVTAIEKTREFKGVYHVLMGALSPLQGIGPDDLKIKGLLDARRRRRRRGSDPRHQSQRRRRGDGDLPGAAAEAARRSVTRIAMGVPVGSDLEYADEVTMHKAMEGRREL